MRTVGRISAAALVAVGLLVAGFLVFTRFAAIHPSAAAAAMTATAYSTGSPPTMCAPPGQMALASGLGLDESCVSDEDLDPNNQPVPDDADIECVTVIDECGNATPLCDDWESWAPTDPGVYLMLVGSGTL